MTTITFIGYGEAGGILADALAKDNPVTVWDCKFDGPERDAMLRKAHRGGVRAATSLTDALADATLVLSTVTAGSALEVATQAAGIMSTAQYYLDLNSVAPQTKRQAAALFKPGAYVDVAVMAPVPPAALRTPLLTGGPQAQAIASLLTALGCNARHGGNDVGSVSAIKMCRSVMIKGMEALTAECLFAAREYGVEEAVLASLHASFPSMGWDNTLAGYLISRIAEHGIRRSEEMEEVVKTLRDVAGESVMSEATAKAQRHLPQRMVAQGINYIQLHPFDWKALATLLKTMFKRTEQHVWKMAGLCQCIINYGDSSAIQIKIDSESVWHALTDITPRTNLIRVSCIMRLIDFLPQFSSISQR